jgi:hypothetical protein
MRERQTLPDMTFIRREIPIADVARELGVRVAGRSVAHCWRVGAHQNGDRTPSLSFRRNRAKCYVCDPDSMSVIDLVIKHHEFEPGRGLREATDWICAHWTVPTIAKNAKLSRQQRWSTSPVGFSSFPLEDLVRSGVWAALDDPARAVLPVLFCFAEKGEACVSYRGLARYSGKKSDATISIALQQFKQLGIIEALPKSGKTFRDAGRYRFTLDSPKFQAALSEVHARLKTESGAERELRAQSRIAALPGSRNPKALYPGTTLYSNCSVSKVHTSPRCSVQLVQDVTSDKGNESLSEVIHDENKVTCESSHYTLVKCEDVNSPLVPCSEKCDTRLADEEKRPISDDTRTGNKTSWTTPHFTTVKCESETEDALAGKLARSIATSRRWSEIAGERWQ